jgi:ABC-type molybdenum transport system ATPase subunit/photorepair protein PhrA
MWPAGADGSLGSEWRAAAADGFQIRREAVMQTLTTASESSNPSASATPAVEVVDLRRRYGSFEAVRGISFSVRAGEVLALLSVNGAGKTSALEVVEGLARLTAARFTSSATIRCASVPPCAGTWAWCCRTQASSPTSRSARRWRCVGAR